MPIEQFANPTPPCTRGLRRAAARRVLSKLEIEKNGPGGMPALREAAKEIARLNLLDFAIREGIVLCEPEYRELTVPAHAETDAGQPMIVALAFEDRPAP